MNEHNARSPAAHVPLLAQTLAAESFSRGERAALKRMGLDGAAPLALHRFILRYVDQAWQTENWLSDWRTLVCSLALQRDGGYDPQRPFGRMLAESRFAESRLERLLVAHDGTLRALALRAARQVAAKGIAGDWRQFATLLFSRNADSRERINTRIARDYYRHVETEQKKEG